MKRKKPRYDNPFHLHRGQKPGLGGVHKAIVETAAMGFDVVAERLEERAQRKDAQRDQSAEKVCPDRALRRAPPVVRLFARRYGLPRRRLP